MTNTSVLTTATGLLLCLWWMPSPAAADESDQDCAAAPSEVALLICGDEELAALQGELAEAYGAALDSLPARERPGLESGQRDWRATLDECLAATDPAGCLNARLLTRTVSLQISYGKLPAPIEASYRCRGTDGPPLIAAFYNGTVPASVVISLGRERVVAPIAPSGSGAKYATEGVEFWEHHGEATVYWFGSEFNCQIIR